MKKTMRIRWMAACLFLAGTVAAYAGKESESAVPAAKQVLIVGLDDNVKSNYFYNGMIAEETGMPEDSIAQEYNAIIAGNIALGAKNGRWRFIPASSALIPASVWNEIQVKGESEYSYADLSAVSTDEIKSILQRAGADYLLVLNQHYLQWQERPLRTLFHIVSYSLFDPEKHEILRGNHYFTSMSLENPERLRKISRKSASKIASAVIRTLDEQ